MSNAHQTLFKLATSLAKFAEDNEKISLPLFTVKLAQAQAAHPDDYTIGMLSRVISKMANSDKLFISRAEVKDLYEKFYSRNNKFATVFSEELGQAEVVEAPLPVAEENHLNDAIQSSYDSIVDPVLAASLNKAFGGTNVKEYTETIAKQAVSLCVSKFKDLGFRVSANVACGKDRVLVCAVAFETPRGTTSVLVPVETTDNHVLYSPDCFVANAGVEELTKDTIYNYLLSRAGETLQINAHEVLNASLVAKGNDNEISNVDLALTKLNAQNETKNEYSHQQIMGVKIAEVDPNLVLNIPKITDPTFEAIAKTFDTEIGYASFKFGTKLVDQGKALIAKRLDSCSAGTYNIAVFATSDDALTYSVALNGGSVAFKVPLKVENHQILPPTILLCNGSVQSFDKTSLNSLLRTEGFDRTAALSASPLYGVKPSELVKIVKAAIAEENYIKAEDALNVLSDSEDTKAYEIALAAFTYGLGHKTAEVEQPSKCTMKIASSSSQYEICGHTGLPVHKVYQDKHGHCIPGYRQGMADSYEGTSFTHTKVYL